MKTVDKPLRIFVVDDHRDVAEGLADVLRMHGHEVEVAFNGEQAIRTFREKDFDIAFMDVMMPGMNGVESFLEIRKIKPAAKVFMMTGYSVEQLLDQAVEKGAYGVLHKPVAMEDVLEAIERVKSQGMVLVADDDPEFSASIREVLEDRGYRVCLARTGSEALKTVMGGGVDILVLDLQLPVISGLEVYMQLRKRGRAVPTVVVTGHSHEQTEAIDTLRAVSSTGILTKPFASTQLFEEIERLMIPAEVADAVESTQAAEPTPAEPTAPEPVAEVTNQASSEWRAVAQDNLEALPEAVVPAAAESPPPAPEQPSAEQLDPKPQVPAELAPQPESVAAPVPAPQAAAPVPESIGRILAVDDDVDMVEGLAEVLRTRGYEVRTANDAESAQRIILEFDAQVALLDIRLGKANGLELIPALKAERPNIYCIMITGNADKESAITALRVGAYDYMTKPLHPSELFSILERCLEKFDMQNRLDQAFAALQEAKNEAETMSRKGAEFLAKLTEELGVPVGEIVSSSKAFIDEAWGPIGAPQYAEHAMSMRDNAAQVLDTLKCSLDLVKAQAGQLEISEDKINIGDLMKAAVRLIKDSIDVPMPSIEIKMPDSPPVIWGDERHFDQILVNLLSNAVKFTPETGEIKLTMEERPDGTLAIEIRDNGAGMATSEIPTALTQFGRASNPAGREFPGAGLGLPLALAMIELHGGSLNLESDLGKGTVATVTIPAARVDRSAEGYEGSASVGIIA